MRWLDGITDSMGQDHTSDKEGINPPACPRLAWEREEELPGVDGGRRQGTGS